MALANTSGYTIEDIYSLPDWIADPLKNRITVYNFEAGITEEYQMQDTVPVGIFEGLWIDFSQII